MKADEIKISDWQRILVGAVPGEFYIELLIRGAFVYLLLMVAMRLMGKRMSSQLSRNQLAAMVSLAGAIGVPLQAPDRGILPAVVIAIVIVSIERWIASRAFVSQAFEHYTQGNISMLIKNAVMDMDVLLQVRLTPERLTAELRSQGIKHLGEIKRFYMEANGSFTLIKSDEPGPGLSVLPLWDTDFINRQPKSRDTLTCENCGNLRPKNGDMHAECTNCKKQVWIPAAVS